MSNFLLLSTEVGLWDTSTKATWGSLDFCPVVTWFQVCTIMQTQLTALSQTGALGAAEKPWQDMAFVLITPSLAIGYEWVFGLTAMWVHPHQAHLPTLGEAAQKLMLLPSKSPNWPYAYAQMNHAPLSSEGHIGIVTDNMPSMNACSHLDQLQVWKLLQCGGQVVCPEGLNGGLKALLFDFEELLLWNATTTDETTCNPSLIEEDLSSMEPEVTNTTPALPLFPAIEPPCDIATAFKLHLQVAFEWLQWTSPATSDPILQHSIPGRKPPSVAWGFCPPPDQKIHSAWRGWTVPDPVATFYRCPYMQSCQKMSLALSKSVTHQPCLPCQKLWRWPISPPLHSLRLPQGLIQPTCQMRCFDCKGRWMWPWSGFSWLRPPWTPTEESWCRMPILPCTKMRPRLPRPSKRLKCTRKRQRSAVQAQPRRQRPVMPSMPAPWNNPTRKACLSWSMRQ